MIALGHLLTRELIAKHGTDRYPTVQLQVIKCLEELGELAGAVLEDDGSPECRARIRKEYADAGLALHALGDKLGLDLIREMATVVSDETRTFTEQARGSGAGEA